MATKQTYAFECPEEDCDFVALIDWIPPTRIDPGYLDGDPPEECPTCGADMTPVIDEGAEQVNPDDYRDWDSEPGGADYVP